MFLKFNTATENSAEYVTGPKIFGKDQNSTTDRSELMLDFSVELVD